HEEKLRPGVGKGVWNGRASLPPPHPGYPFLDSSSLRLLPNNVFPMFQGTQDHSILCSK
ncbi:Rhesus blood group-associated C glycoprotein, isoform CRA_a, partial [Mus musculus]